MNRLLYQKPAAARSPGRRPKPLRSRHLQRGVTLLEVLVATAILGMCMLFMTQLLVQESLIERRIQARVASLRLREAHVELLRAGLGLPSEEGEYEMDLVVEPVAGSGLENPELDLVLEELEPRGLWRVDLTLSYTLAGHPLTQTIEMRVWRP